MDKPQIILYAEKSTNFTLFDCKWIPYSAKFIVLGNQARGTGAFHIYELASGEIKIIKESEKPKSFKCGTFGASNVESRHFATGDFDGNLQIWDLERLETPIYSVKAHKEIVNSIDGIGGMGIGEGAPEILTASRDGAVKVWDPRQKDTPVAVIEPAENEAKRDAWTAVFGHAYNAYDRCVCSGYDNGDIKLFDLRNMSLRWETNVKNGVCCLDFDRKDIIMNKLLATTLESKIHMFDMRTQNPTTGFAYTTEKAHGSTVWLGKHLPQNREISMTCGGSGSMYLWQYKYPSSRVAKDSSGNEVGVAGNLQLLQNVGLSTQPISSFNWSNDKLGLAVSTAFDQTIRVIVVTKLNTL